MQKEKNKMLLSAEPCRNFNILGSTIIADPKDGREKAVLSNFAAGSTGNLIFIDTETGEGESVKLAGDEGGWAILNLRDEKLLIGTCSRYGYLHCLDLKTRTWAEPLRDEDEQYIWNLVVGSDGMVYGGTYPGCVLLRYDPERHVLENMGKMSQNSKDLYSRYVYGGVPGYILISGGFGKPFLNAWKIDDGSVRTIMDSDTNLMPTVREVNEKFICVSLGDELYFFDAISFEAINDPYLKEKLKPQKRMLLKDGKLFRACGQDYCIKANEEDEPVLRRIPTPAPPTHIHNLVSDPMGKIWGSCGFGQTIFSYDPADGSYWNSSTVCDHGGEVYGMVFADGKLYMTAYSGGDHIVYDPSKPWDQLSNVNPRTLKSLAPKLIRPLGCSVLGPGNGVWTGWAANYGVYGGGLTRIDTSTLEVEYWYDPVPEQQIISVAADESYVYFTTNSGGNGLKDRGEPCHFCVWSTEGSLILDYQFEKGIPVGPVQCTDGKVLVAEGINIKVFDPAKMEFVRSVPLGRRTACMLNIGNSKVLAFCKDDIYMTSTVTWETEYVAGIPGFVASAAVTPAGDIYYAYGTKLYKLDMPLD